ncbi:MAG TPA: GAF domain-containing protein [Candidatus Krumholzibacteria bacterium]|nr:GAF domain-containing protein [Candidatus Krumholzibacteria bacterium]HPD71562.1 GAF domain-containing protein [Candidatus Krumholzibacteria bacterium]HRY41505.1 GAF domain-containing protein [Candidatus Krumholzibacteria bacterium]
MSERLSIVLGAPGEAEMPLFADLGARDDIVILAVVDPTGQALGSAIAEIMGVPVHASLDEFAAPAGATPVVVLPAGAGALAASLADAAARRGLPTIRQDELRAQLALRRRPAAPRPLPPRPGLEQIECESAAIQATLAGLEDALAGDAILRQLLDLCTRSVGAGGGSILLFDRASRELYIAYATGLSEGTLHSTRVKLGEGIAGRVARTRRAELVEGAQGVTDRHRDRPDIATAISTPLVAGDRLLGVLNVSTQAGQPPLDTSARDLLAGLSIRLGRILDGVQQLQQQRTSRMFDLTEQQLRRVAVRHRELPEMLTAWSAALAVTAEAERVSLVIPCEDGGLLTCESAPGEDGRHWYEPLHNPAWLEVLGSGVPLVARQDDLSGGIAAPVTAFYLPIGREPVRAGLSMSFASSRAAHAFHALAGETVFLLERLLPDQLDQRRHAHRAQRLGDLSETLAELAAFEGSLDGLAERVCAAACRLTGSRHAAAIAEIRDGDARPAGGNLPDSAPWLGEIPRLLHAAARGGWRITTLETGSTPLSVLVATTAADQPTPGIILIGKQRTNVLDGQVFTPLDAELVLPLVGLLGRLRPAAPLSPEVVLDLRPPFADVAERRPAPVGARAPAGEEQLLADLRRELDRCTRYHNVCGVVLLRPALPASTALDLLQACARRVEGSLRISDRVYPTADHCLAVLVPEEVQHLDHLRARLVTELRTLAGDPQLRVESAWVAYPATRGTAADLLALARQRLQA